MKKFEQTRSWSASKKFMQESVLRKSVNTLKPKISFEYLTGKYCISKCESREKAEVIDTLHRISKSTWQELIQCGKAVSGYEQIGRKQLKCSVPVAELFINIDKAAVFHRKNKIPVIGFKIEETFYIFCIDRDYSAYDHG